jgi:hypothetical protein
MNHSNGLTAPTEALVKAACEEFDREDWDIEKALTDLFSQYPDNRNRPHVLLKVVALNALYSTQIRLYSYEIPDVMDVTGHIHRNGQEIDQALADGRPEAVDTIASISVSGKKDRRYFSFATKYCSWHRPEFYPIYDSRVDRYISCLKTEPPFAEFFNTGEEHWRYAEFRGLISTFRDHYALGSFTFKEIDKFLYLYGGKL